MSFLDKLKHKAEELDLQKKANELAEQAKVAAQQAKEKAGELAHENRDRIEGLADKAGHAIDEKTGGKYADKIAKAKEQVNRGVDKVAEQRPVHDVPGPVPPVANPGFTQPDVPPVAEPASDGVGVPPAAGVGYQDAPVPSDTTGDPAVRPDTTSPAVTEPDVSEAESVKPATSGLDLGIDEQAGDAPREDG